MVMMKFHQIAFKMEHLLKRDKKIQTKKQMFHLIKKRV